MDKLAPMPFVRKCPSYKVDTVEFEFERTKQVEETIIKRDKKGDIVEESTVVKTSKKDVKVTLKTWGKSANEDTDHFFEALETLKKELEVEWEAASAAKNRDASLLFRGFRKMCIGTAATDWNDIVGTESQRDWEMWKTMVAKYINTKVLPADAYNQQHNYLTERTKPMKLDAEQWYARYQTINNRLPYFIQSMEQLKTEFPTADFTRWWVDGSLSEAAMKRAILNKIPNEWNKLLRRNDIANQQRDTQPLQKLMEWFAGIELDEATDRERAKNKERNTRGHGSPRRRQTTSSGSNDRYRSENRHSQYRRSSRGIDYNRTGRQSNNSNNHSGNRHDHNQPNRDRYHDRYKDRPRYANRRYDDRQTDNRQPSR